MKKSEAKVVDYRLVTEKESLLPCKFIKRTEVQSKRLAQLFADGWGPVSSWFCFARAMIVSTQLVQLMNRLEAYLPSPPHSPIGLEAQSPWGKMNEILYWNFRPPGIRSAGIPQQNSPYTHRGFPLRVEPPLSAYDLISRHVVAVIQWSVCLNTSCYSSGLTQNLWTRSFFFFFAFIRLS